MKHVIRKENYPGWSPRDNQRCSELKNSALFQSKLAPNQRCSALKTQYFRVKKTKAEQRWFGANLLWMSSDIYTSRWEYQHVMTSQKW